MQRVSLRRSSRDRSSTCLGDSHRVPEVARRASIVAMVVAVSLLAASSVAIAHSGVSDPPAPTSLARRLVRAGLCTNMQPLVASAGREATCDSTASGLEVHVYAAPSTKTYRNLLSAERVSACALSGPSGGRTYVVSDTWFVTFLSADSTTSPSRVAKALGQVKNYRCP
jgi:hypothetical protein